MAGSVVEGVWGVNDSAVLQRPLHWRGSISFQRTRSPKLPDSSARPSRCQVGSFVCRLCEHAPPAGARGVVSAYQSPETKSSAGRVGMIFAACARVSSSRTAALIHPSSGPCRKRPTPASALPVQIHGPQIRRNGDLRLGFWRRCACGARFRNDGPHAHLKTIRG